MELRRTFRVRAIRALAAAAPIFAALFGVLALTLPAPTAAVQTVPYLINFQGRLTDNNGNVLSDGSYNVKFRIFDASTSGTNLWEGDRVSGASDHRITIQNGLFNIQFGDTTQGDPALSPSLFNTQTHPSLYLEVELPTPATATCSSNGCASWTEGAMTPRQPLASATYAFNSDTLDGLDSTAFGQLAAANTFTAANLFAPTASSTVALTVKASTAGGSNALEVFDSGGARQAYFDATGSLNLANINQTGAYLLQTTTDSTTALRVLTSSGAGSRAVLQVGTSNTQVSADANLIVNSSVTVPTLTSVGFASNSTGTLSGAAANTYFYKISAIVGSETAASNEQWINASGFTPLSAPSAPSIAQGASGGFTGTNYTYKYTYLTANGETTASPASNALTINNRKITVTIANGPSGTTGKKIYRTASNGSTWLLVTTINDNTTTSYTDSTTDASLGTSTPPSANTATTNLNSVTLTFPAFSGATGYSIYRGTSTLGEDHYQTAGSCSGTCTFTDTGTTGTAGTPTAPTAGRVGIGTTTPNYALDVSGNVSASSSFISGGQVGQTQSCGSGSTFSGLTVTGGIVTAIGSCSSIGGGSASASLQSAYANSTVPQITLSSGGGALTVRDSAAGLGTDLFEVQDNTGGTTYLGVSATGISTSGSVNIATGQTYQINGTPISTSALSNGSSVTLQGNTFNGSSQLVQTTAGGALPTLSGANLTSLNPTNLAAGSGAVTLASGGSSGITLDSSSNVIQIAADDTTLQRVTTGSNLTYTIDLKDTSNTTLAITNSGAGTGNLTVEGTINGASISGGSLSGTAVNGLSVSSGTITVGTWQGTAVGAQYGGTGQTTFAIGDLLYASSSAALSKLSETATAGQCLVSGQTGVSSPSWSSCSSASGASTSLNNLVSTSINQDLLPDTTFTRSLGSATDIWKNLYIGVIDTQSSTNTTLSVGTSNAQIINIGNTTAATATSIQGGTTGGIAIGSTGSTTTGSKVDIADTSNATGTQAVTIGSNANTSNTVDIDAGTGASAIEIGDTGTAHGIKIGANAAGVQTILVGNIVGGSQTTISGGILATSGAQGVVIGGGFSTSDTNLVALTLDSSSTFAETASTCTASVNGGALYYNSTSNAIRGCINGNWEDVVSTGALGLQLFGVVPDSGPDPGNWVGTNATLANDGPCKVYMGSTTASVRWTGCVAYSGGRKVIVAAQTSDQAITTGNAVWAHVCLNGTNNQPTVTNSVTETTGLPAFSATAPVLCLADIVTTNAAGGHITEIYDTRTFTTTTKEIVNNITTAPGLGMVAQQTSTAGSITRPAATAGLGSLRGVFVATAGGTTAGQMNAIIATAGPAYIKSTAGTITNDAETGTGAAGYAITTATVPAPTIGYGSMGMALSAFSNTCGANADNCRGSLAVNLALR